MIKDIILDTDIGYDPDDLFALLFLLKLPQNCRLTIVTANELEHKRSNFLGKIRELLDRNFAICEGEYLGSNKFIVDELSPMEYYNPDYVLIDDEYLFHMANLCKSFTNLIYIGIGGFTNLSKFIEAFPKEARKMKIFLMGGAINYERHEDWIEYNVRMDPVSTEKVINADLDITLVMAQTTHNPLYEITQESSLYKKLKQSYLPEHKLLADHCDLWFKEREFKHGTSMHDPLTVATALGYDFLNLERAKVSIKNGKFVLDENGHEIKYSLPDSKAKEFMDFLEETIT